MDKLDLGKQIRAIKLGDRIFKVENGILIGIDDNDCRVKYLVKVDTTEDLIENFGRPSEYQFLLSQSLCNGDLLRQEEFDKNSFYLWINSYLLA